MQSWQRKRMFRNKHYAHERTYLCRPAGLSRYFFALQIVYNELLTFVAMHGMIQWWR